MLLCIDASYILFYRIHALKTWYTHRSKEQATDELLVSDEFKQKLCKMIGICIATLCTLYKPAHILFAYDGHTNWRKQYDTEYKATRSYPQGVSQLFQYGVACLRAKGLESLGCQASHIIHESLEADDLIHYVVRKRNSQHHPNHLLETTIVANDYDYLPLLQYVDTVRIYNLKNKLLTLPPELSGDQYLQMKIILGDKSDNISSVLKRCGPKTATNLVTHAVLFNEKITNGDAEVQRKYERNRTLIDNRCVPEAYQKWMCTTLQPFWQTDDNDI
jgi:5'-3' exonuclease